MENHTLSFLQKIIQFTIVIFCFLLPLERIISTYTIVILVILSLIFLFVKKKFTYIKYIFLPFLLYLLYIIGSIQYVSVNFRAVASTLETMGSLAVFPLIFFFINFDLKKSFIYALKAFIWGCLFACFVNLLYSFHLSLNIFDNIISFDPRVLKDPRIDNIKSLLWGGNYFFYKNLSHFHSGNYFSLYLVFSIYIILYLLYNNNIKNKKAYYFCIVIFTIFIFLLASVAALSSFLLSYLILSILIVLKRYNEKKANKALYVITLVFIFFFIGIIFYINPRVYNFSKKIIESNWGEDEEIRNNKISRIIIWKTAIELIKESPLLGYGTGSNIDVLMKSYRDNRYVSFAEEKLNAHNQYMETFLSIGVIGFLVFILTLTISFIYSIRTKNYLLTALIAIFAFNCLFESMLHRYSGVVFFSFFYCFLIHSHAKLKK